MLIPEFPWSGMGILNTSERLILDVRHGIFFDQPLCLSADRALYWQ